MLIHLSPLCGGENIKPGASEILFEQFPDLLVIIHDEDLLTFRHLFISPCNKCAD